MLTLRNLQRHYHYQSLKTLSSLLNQNPNSSYHHSNLSNSLPFSPPNVESSSSSSSSSWNLGFRRWMATSKRPSMRSRVEKRMQRESGKTLRQIRTAKKLKLKLMTEEERLLYNLRRAKKKVALLLQKLKKYELPELPPSRHDPELLTSEQLQAYKKIGYRNKNYCPVGVRGVFGGVVQNMHLHWKFHETVQVCCDNFPKEKIKEMATMLARLSGGIVINIHNVKTIIMFRGRNYRQPKNLIPVNTLTKRKALFKARFEQALESQKLNIKKIEQQLRKKGVNPDDPVAMASLHKVASTFFNALDKKDGSPFVFRGDDESPKEPQKSLDLPGSAEDSDQEELDKFIAEIEDAADKEWETEEAAEKEELGKIRYWNREDSGGRFKPERYRDNDFDDGVRDRPRSEKNMHQRARIADSDDEDGASEDEGSDSWEHSDEDDANEDGKHSRSRVEQWKPERARGFDKNRGFKNDHATVEGKGIEEEGESEKIFSDLDDIMWQSDSEEGNIPRRLRPTARKEYYSGGDDEDDYDLDPVVRKKSWYSSQNESKESDDHEFSNGTEKQDKRGRVNSSRRDHGADYNRKWARNESETDEVLSDSEIPRLQIDEDDNDEEEEEDDDELSALRAADDDYTGVPYHHAKEDDNGVFGEERVSRKRKDENWDSD